MKAYIYISVYYFLKVFSFAQNFTQALPIEQTWNRQTLTIVLPSCMLDEQGTFYQTTRKSKLLFIVGVCAWSLLAVIEEYMLNRQDEDDCGLL